MNHVDTQDGVKTTVWPAIVYIQVDRFTDIAIVMVVFVDDGK